MDRAAVNVPSGVEFHYNIDGYALLFIEGVQTLGGKTGVVARLIDVFGCDCDSHTSVRLGMRQPLCGRKDRTAAR